METNAIIYARVSSVGERQSTERQVSDLRRYAEYSGFRIKRIFEEKISGAKKNLERPVLLEAIEYAKNNNIKHILISELSRLGRNAFEVLSTVKEMIDNGINIYFQKEQFSLLDEEGKPSLFAPIMIATLSTCAQLERDNIKFRLNSGRENYIAKGGKLGRKKGSIKSEEKLKEEYKETIQLLRKGYSVRNIAKLQGIGISTVQRVKNQFVNNIK
ncbi:recombinase family protein [Bacteroides caecigallinarum]|uniref:recombinase family protein n=1 Tax=Bacteroides caecigallinarum TaxID=1411144 RepID=UPI001F24EF81|nr:recombinase family protein [Bacteroides caecigallinarum]MCF2594002.1 recombinase family protein [Bacteroides caecigallinarum]